MKKKTTAGLIAIVVIAAIAMFAGCVEEPSAPTATPIPTPKTELSLGESAIVDDISFTVVKYEFTDSYEESDPFLEKYTSHRPPEGAKFLWIYVKAKNVGDVKHYLPGRSDVDILYKSATIRGEFFWCPHLRETYGGDDVYPGVDSEGWILYEVPAGINMTQAKIRVEFPKAKGLYGSEICGTKTWRLAS